MELAGPCVVRLLLQGIHLHTKSRIRDHCFVLLRHVQLVLLREPCASVPLTQDLELRPVCCELLRKTPLRLDGARQGGLLVLGVGRLWGSNLSPIVCLVETVKLREDEGARAGVLGARCRGCGGVPAFVAALPCLSHLDTCVCVYYCSTYYKAVRGLPSLPERRKRPVVKLCSPYLGYSL